MSRTTSTWRKEITLALKANNEKWGDIIVCTLTTDQCDEEFDGGFGCVEGKAFTVWTARNVYFPICYDGSEWAGSAPRNPSDKETQHQGG